MAASWASGGGRMYAHGLATIVLCEALAMSGDDSLRPAAQRRSTSSFRAQHDEGGWRYYPGEEGDTSVVGWQLMALQSGKIAYLDVPKSTFRRAGRFLDTVQVGRRGGLFAYQPGRGPSPAMTAEGLLCRQYLGWTADNRALREGINRLIGRGFAEHGSAEHLLLVLRHAGDAPRRRRAVEEMERRRPRGAAWRCKITKVIAPEAGRPTAARSATPTPAKEAAST